jgi:hypothetical protein
MTNIEFQKLLKEVFGGHPAMKGRDHHTVNELLHVLRYDERFSGLEGVNVTVLALDTCLCIPSLTAFVSLEGLSVWFDDMTIELEVDEFEDDGKMMRFNNITVCEMEVA